jgi:hypothetical protein
MPAYAARDVIPRILPLTQARVEFEFDYVGHGAWNFYIRAKNQQGVVDGLTELSDVFKKMADQLRERSG